MLSGALRLPEVQSTLPADLYYWPRPHSYTGQNVLELHSLAAPPLIELALAHVLNAGARPAQPGEFTMRAFLAGKLDLPRAEAVFGVIEARSRDELKHALAQLAGGLAQPLYSLREDLLNLRADVEAALDFSDEDLQFVDNADLLHRLTRGLGLVTLVRKQIDHRSTSGRVFRAVLMGRPNAGKSSLFNALAESENALVSPQAGTTRDFLRATLYLGDVRLELIDTAGLRGARDAIEQSAQALGLDQAENADLVLWCQEPRQEDEGPCELLPVLGALDVIRVGTKCDEGSVQGLATSAVTGAGLGELRQLLADRVRTWSQVPLAPSLSRCRHHVERCLDHLRAAHACALNMDPPEILALELQATLDELGSMVGAVYTDDLLDRIFSRFCIGK